MLDYIERVTEAQRGQLLQIFCRSSDGGQQTEENTQTALIRLHWFPHNVYEVMHGMSDDAGMAMRSC